MISWFVAAALLLARGGVPVVTPEDALQGPFVARTALHVLDPAVTSELHRRIPEFMADAGEPFEPTDIRTGRLPSRRFLVAGVSTLSSQYWIVCYEHGGRGFHYHIAFFQVVAGKASVLKSGQWLPRMEFRDQEVTVARVLEAIQNGEVEYDNHW